jgi:hypothetical protein
VLLGKIFSPEENFLERIKYFLPMPILMRNLERRQITRNDSKVISLSENDTLPVSIQPPFASPRQPAGRRRAPPPVPELFTVLLRGARLDPVYYCASTEDVDRAANLAEEAFGIYSNRENPRLCRMIFTKMKKPAFTLAF